MVVTNIDKEHTSCFDDAQLLERYVLTSTIHPSAVTAAFASLFLLSYCPAQTAPITF